MEQAIEIIIKQLGLLPHPEGGYYREYYRSEGKIPPDSLPRGCMGYRNYATSIYFLLYANNFSAFHRIKQDEIWHFYQGSSILIHEIDTDGNYQVQRLGCAIEEGIFPQYTVKAGTWFASEMANLDGYALVGCTVAPGFSFDDFELAVGDELAAQFPQHRPVIERLTRQ